MPLDKDKTERRYNRGGGMRILITILYEIDVNLNIMQCNDLLIWMKYAIRQ